MDLQETKARNGYAGEGQQQFNWLTDLAVSQELTVEDQLWDDRQPAMT
jgi:hypothetical protein